MNQEPGNCREAVTLEKDEGELANNLVETLRDFIREDSLIIFDEKTDLNELMQNIVKSVDWEGVASQAKSERQKEFKRHQEKMDEAAKEAFKEE